MLILDCCGAGAWAREMRFRQRTDVIVQAACRPGQLSVPNQFWYKWARFQHFSGDPPPLPEKPVPSKTILCNDYEGGSCRRGSQCSHAHGDDDLLILEELQDYSGENGTEAFTEPEAYLPWSVEESMSVELFSKTGERKPGIFVLT